MAEVLLEDPEPHPRALARAVDPHRQRGQTTHQRGTAPLVRQQSVEAPAHEGRELPKQRHRFPGLRLDFGHHLAPNDVLVRSVLRDSSFRVGDALSANQLALVLGFPSVRLAAALLNGLLGLTPRRFLPSARLFLHLHHLRVALPRLFVLGVVPLARELVLVLLHLRVLLRPRAVVLRCCSPRSRSAAI